MNFLVIKKKMMRMVESVYLMLSKFFLFLPWCVGKILRQRDMTCNFLLPFSQAAEELSDCFVTCNLRPKEAKNYHKYKVFDLIDFSNIAIVIQGPILKKSDFTLETIKLYNRFYHNCNIILSTWSDEDTEYLNRIKEKSNCIIVISDKPELAGSAHSNFQRISTLAGIRKAREIMGRGYIFKSRTDWRHTNPFFLIELRDKVETFPCYDELGIKQNKRIVIFGSKLFYPFSLQEFMNFGEMDDMLDFWNYQPDVIYREETNTHLLNYQAKYEEKTYVDLLKEYRGGEGVFVYNYFMRKSNDTKISLDFWWNIVLKNYFICMSVSATKPLWYKYDYCREENIVYNDYYRSFIFPFSDTYKDFISFELWKLIFDGKLNLNDSDYKDILTTLR